MAKKTKKRPSPRVAILKEEQLNPTQRALLDAMRSGPRGKALPIRGPFAAFLHAPAFGDLAQRLGAHCRYRTTVPPRLSEFAILCTARLWRAQFEWYAHEPMALKAGVSAKTVRDLKAGRVPKSAPKDERAIYEFVQELYKARRISDRTYKKVRSFLSDESMVELVGVLGYYSLISMTLNVFQMLPPLEDGLAFPET
ncbi:MAG TPA: carboxymuconolactone decarboxylase family protein [Pseudolabrys sp.]|jgi:4-carboxymuconolactone decarboxylase|nr:carboxymuconolactone decarboxylase family protein [Pseudolabrys sp.]